ncbi:MAG: zinc-ribbon domain-containing protein, partial [Acutalibacter sp.]|nr:zinc-ribbon domain-containing protein [Acutalibacter sp.]
MKCPKCGKELQKGAKFCQTCGNRIEEPSDSHENNPKKKRKYLIPLTALVLVIAIGAVVLVCSGMFKKEETEIEKVQQGFEDYFDLENHVSEVISSYKNAEGYIEKDSLNDSISAVGNYAKELYDSKEIKDYEVTEGESVWIQFNSGVEYIYIPSVEGMDSSTVSTYQPCLAMYHSELQKLGVDCVDGAANCVENVLNEYRFKHNYDNDAISLDVLKNMGENEIVIWHGHGGYNRKTHSVLQTGLKLDEARFLLDPVYYIQNMGYTDDYLTGRILCTSSGYACVTYKFFDKYLPNMNSDIVYLGACSSGKDDVLANTFINKGAKTVIANTEIIPTVYNLNMISAVFSELTIPLDNKYQDVQTALARAKDTNADIYERTECIADVRIWGEKGTRLSEEEITAENGTEGSIEGPLPESEDVRAVVGNGNYSVGCDGGTYYWKYSSSNIDPVYTLVFEDKNGDIKQLYDGTSRSEIYSLHDMLVVNQKTVD